jgi:predicted transcriptional regulator
MSNRACAWCKGPIPADKLNATYCRAACRQARYKAGAGQARGTVRLDDVVHLLRFGVRLDEIAARLHVSAKAVVRAAQRAAGRTPEGMTDLDVAQLRRLVGADQTRTRNDHMAEQQDRAREWRWAS